MRLARQSILILLVTLVLAESGARLFLPQPGLQPFPPNQPASLLVQDPQRSYAYRPGFNGKVHEEPQAITVSINALGMRDDSVAAGEAIDVLAVGDSFTVGYMVNASEAWPERLEYYLQKYGVASRPARVLNGGVSGYSLRQIRLTAEKYAGLAPKLVVAGVLPFVADRLVNPYEWYEGYAVRAAKIPFLKKVDEGFLTAIPGSALSAQQQFWLMQNFKFGAAVWLAFQGWRNRNTPEFLAATSDTEDLLRRLEDEIAAMQTFTQANGQQLIVMLIAFQQADGSFSNDVARQNKRISDFCASRGIPVFDPTSLFKARAGDPVLRISAADYHWTPLAHDIAAEGFAQFLAALGKN